MHFLDKRLGYFHNEDEDEELRCPLGHFVDDDSEDESCDHCQEQRIRELRQIQEDIEGPGSTLDKGYEWFHHKLKKFLANVGSARHGPHSSVASAEVDSDLKSHFDFDMSEHATSGPGRVLDIGYTWIGKKFEDLVLENIRHHGVLGVASAISFHRRHDELSIVDLYDAKSSQYCDADKKVDKYCKKLMRYARSLNREKRLLAYNIIIHLAVFDPVVREKLAREAWSLKSKAATTHHDLLFVFRDGKVIRDDAMLCDDSNDMHFAAAWKVACALEGHEIHEFWKKFYHHLIGTPTLERRAWYDKTFLPCLKEYTENPKMSFFTFRHSFYLLKFASKAFTKGLHQNVVGHSHQNGEKPSNAVERIDTEHAMVLINDIMSYVQNAYLMKIDEEIVEESIRLHQGLISYT
ncbi:hypothetical protein SCHPADRAFT_1002426 [Schizopora paradoxa]|uniref:Uncharacterized protein n=1 Tax=Schizopora paradoxa TaxID=27342 RepID=A0A0H2R4P9_9AGAM|nr:hypothetical protein SCHPADRAFT_1002426 [Schizopora paradoxa]